MTVDDALNQMLTCVPITGCKHESACFLVARTLHNLRRENAVSNEPDPRYVVRKTEPLPELEIPHYAPTWESQRSPMPTDWSAA